MSTLNRSRQLEIFSPEQAVLPVTVIGAGGIGSTAVLTLAKMGISDITVYDHDTVDGVNLPSQMYGLADVGQPKAVALKRIVGQFSDCRLKAMPERWDGQPLAGLVIAAADSMEVRAQVWQAVKLNPLVELLIDTRMGGQVMHLLTARPCDPDDIEHYEQFLFSSREASPAPCGAQAIAYNTFGIASIVCSLVRRWLTEGEVPRRILGDYATLTFVTQG